MTSTEGKAQDVDVTDSGLLSDPGGQAGPSQPSFHTLQRGAAASGQHSQDQASSSSPKATKKCPSMEEVNHTQLAIESQDSSSVCITMEDVGGLGTHENSSFSSSPLQNPNVDPVNSNLPSTSEATLEATASELNSTLSESYLSQGTFSSQSPRLASGTTLNPGLSQTQTSNSHTPSNCSSCGLSSSTPSSTASSSSSSPASSSGVSLSSPGTSASPPAELLPVGGTCSPVDSGTSSCPTLGQEEEGTFSTATPGEEEIKEVVIDDASTPTLSRSSCSNDGGSSSSSKTSVGSEECCGSSNSDVSNSSADVGCDEKEGHEQLNSKSVLDRDSRCVKINSNSTEVSPYSTEVNGASSETHVLSSGGTKPTLEQHGGHYASVGETVSDGPSTQPTPHGAELQPQHNTHNHLPTSSPLPNPQPAPRRQPPPLPPRPPVNDITPVSSRATATGEAGVGVAGGAVDVCGRCGGRRVQAANTCSSRLELTATSDFSPLTDDTSALLAADELARTCSQHQLHATTSSSHSDDCGCVGRVWGGGDGRAVVGGGQHPHPQQGGGEVGGGGGSSSSGRRALPPVTLQSHVAPSRAEIQIQNSLQESNNSRGKARVNTGNTVIDTSRSAINLNGRDNNKLDIADSPTFITDKTTSFISDSSTNTTNGDGGNSTGTGDALKGKTETKTKRSYKDSLIKRYKAYKTAKIEQKQQEQQGRRASIETIMEFDENFHGNDDDDGLDSPMSDCTSLFSLGSDAEACLQEVMEGLGEDYCLTGGGGVSSGDSSPVLGEGRSIRWDKGRRKVRRPRSLTKADYQALRQQCEGSSSNNGGGSSLDPGGNNNNNGRTSFVVQVDGQRLTPEEVADSVVSHREKNGPRMAESSFMEIDNIPSVSQPSTPCMPDLGMAPPGGGQGSENKPRSSQDVKSVEAPTSSSSSARYYSQHNPSYVQSPNGNSVDIALLQGSSSRPSSEVSTSNSSTAASRALSAQVGAAQRPDVLNLNLTSPTSDPGAYGPGGGGDRGGLPASQAQAPGTGQDSTGNAPYLLTPGGHRCCTCGQTIPNPGGNPTDNANNGDSLNGNLISGTTTSTDRTISTVVDVHVNASERDDPGGKDAASDETDVAEPPPVPSRSQTMTPMTPSQRFAYIEALQKEKQRSSIKGQSLAPPLHDNLRYHAFFLYHNNDRDWVLNVMEKLESPTLGFKCCCHERDLDCSLSLPQGVLYGMKNSVKTVVVLSPDFVSSTWSSCEVVVSEMDGVTLQRDLLLVMLQDCDLPNVVTDLPFIDASKRDWWTKMLATLALPDDTPMTEETVLSMSSSLVGLNPGLQSGHLLHSIKSKCLCCGRELVDPTEVPDELIAHGVQIPPEEYCQAIRQLMCETKFRCHIWCYNMPVAMVFFTLFLGLCLAIIPVIETKYMFSGTDLTHPSLPTPASKGVSVQPSKKQTGLEYVHGAVVWLCVLTLYMLCTHLARRKMKDKTYRRLSEVNTVFIKYNLLVGVENLGLADCNKYYLHFFYFELGPCLAYLQELLVNLEECTPCYSNQVLETEAHLEDGEDAEGLSHEASASDRMNVLDQNNITNVSMQTQAEDLLLDHSGEYINMLITKKLDRPRKQRHVKGAYCLCQFVEQRVYKMVV